MPDALCARSARMLRLKSGVGIPVEKTSIHEGMKPGLRTMRPGVDTTLATHYPRRYSRILFQAHGQGGGCFIRRKAKWPPLHDPGAFRAGQGDELFSTRSRSCRKDSTWPVTAAPVIRTVTRRRPRLEVSLPSETISSTGRGHRGLRKPSPAPASVQDAT